MASLGLFALLDARGESRIVYRRATPIDARTGVVKMRIVDEPIVDVPADCPGADKGTFGCQQEQRFPRVYVLDFSLERREVRDAESRVEVEERGRASLFLHFEPSDRTSFDDELRRALAGLSADAFAESFAGLGPSSGVFSGIAARSLEPSWSCFERGPSRQAGRYERYVERGPDGALRVTGNGWSGYMKDEITGPLCQAGETTARSSRADEIRTMPVARGLLETSLRVGFVDGLQERSYAEELAVLPPDLLYTVERDPGVRRSESVHKTDGLVRASYTSDEVKVSASASAAPLAPRYVATNAWVARWTLETLKRSMGPLPGEVLVDRSDLHIALLPTLPPVPLDDHGAPIASEATEIYDVALEPDVFLSEIAERLDAAATIDARSIEDAVAIHPAGLRSRGWLLAICRPDGSADYRLLPTEAVARLENAEVFCAAIERQLAAEGAE